MWLTAGLCCQHVILNPGRFIKYHQLQLPSVIVSCKLSSGKRESRNCHFLAKIAIILAKLVNLEMLEEKAATDPSPRSSMYCVTLDPTANKCRQGDYSFWYLAQWSMLKFCKICIFSIQSPPWNKWWSSHGLKMQMARRNLRPRNETWNKKLTLSWNDHVWIGSHEIGTWMYQMQRIYIFDQSHTFWLHEIMKPSWYHFIHMYSRTLLQVNHFILIEKLSNFSNLGQW